MSRVAAGRFSAKAKLDDDFHLLTLPFRFPHYLQFKDEVVVSANGGFDAKPWGTALHR